MKNKINLTSIAPDVPRRVFLKGSVAAGAVFIAGCASSGNSAETGVRTVTLLDPASQDKFRNELPRLPRIFANAGANLQMPMMETQRWSGLRAPDGSQMMTTVYGFQHQNQVSSPGPTIIVRSNEAIEVDWQNQLPSDKPYLLPIDLSLHIPHLPDQQFVDQKPIVIHLHGGHAESESDGLPEAWFTQNYQTTGADWVKRTYNYDNTQDATGLWYHDHTVGMTRLNAYAGLVGMYLIKDDNEDRLINESIIPNDDHMIELAIRDVLFDDQGNLFLPGRHDEPINPILQEEIHDDWPDPSILDEFFGNFVLVNGMAWPKVDLEPNRYRLRLLNASSNRSYVLEFDNGMEFYQIGSDGGFLNTPVRLTQLLIAPAERMDVVIDFTGHGGEQIVLKNLGPDNPFRGYVDPADPANSTKLVYNEGGNRALSDGREGVLNASDPESSGVVMRFDISTGAPGGGPVTDLQAQNFNPTVALRQQPLQPLPRDSAQTVRQLVLFSLEDDVDRELTLMGTLQSGSLFYMDEITEIVPQGDTEIWEIYNTSHAAHPIHLHQVEFEVVDRQDYDGDLVNRTQQLMGDPNRTFQGATLDLRGLKGDPVLPQPNEQGRKDTALALPGQVTRLIAHFDLAGTYVWHCHMLSHEDYDMMRKFQVTPGS